MNGCDKEIKIYSLIKQNLKSGQTFSSRKLQKLELSGKLIELED